MKFSFVYNAYFIEWQNKKNLILNKITIYKLGYVCLFLEILIIVFEYKQKHILYHNLTPIEPFLKLSALT